jgi:hypothetical protein
MIGLFDVLGFSSLLESRGLDATLQLYRTLIQSVVVEDPRRCLGAIGDGSGGRFFTIFTLPNDHAYFSDTILLWVPLERVFAEAFVGRCADLVCNALDMGVALRGSIALGEAIMDRESGTYIGTALVEAARLEAAQQWMGVTFADSATWPQFLAEIHPNQIIEYDSPRKVRKPGQENFASPVVLDWPRVWRETRKTSLSDAIQALNTSDAHSHYYTNAISFAVFSEQNANWYERPESERPNAKLRMKRATSDPTNA